MAVLKDLKEFVRIVWINIKKEFAGNGYGKSARNFVMIVGSVALVYGGFYAYRWHTTQREARSQRTFSEAMMLYERAFATSGQWEDVADAFSFGYEQNSSSSIAPFFKLFQADALLRQGKATEALAIMDEALGALSENNPLAHLYKTKRARVKLDSDDQALVTAGLQELEVLAKDEKNMARDMARYYWGMYFWDADKIEKSREVWLPLTEKKKDGKPTQFGLLVQARLDQVK